MNKSGIHAEAIHGNKSQNARQRALSNFKLQKTRVLVATDIAARGIDVEDLSTVINFELPNIPETYVHRIGRTGRAGASGISISFCDFDEREFLRDIQKLIGKSIPVVDGHPFPMTATSSSEASPKPAARHSQPRRHGASKPSSSSTQSTERGNKGWGSSQRRYN